MVSQFGSLGYTIMGKTADLTVVQKTIIDTLHKEGKPQTFIPKEAGCSQSAVSKHVNRKLSGRKKCVRKRCTTNRENRSLMRIVNRFKNLGELHKEWTEAGVKASRATTHRRVKEFGYNCLQRHLTWAKEKKNWTIAQWSKVLFSDESKFCISFGNQGPRVWRKGGEAHSPRCLKSSVKFTQSVIIQISKTPVERVNSFKFGVHITKDLTWSAHTDAAWRRHISASSSWDGWGSLERAPVSPDPSTPALWRASWPAASPPGLETAPLATAKLCKGSCELPATLLEVNFPPSRTSTPGGV